MNYISNKRKPLKPFNRKVHICKKTWTYFVGSGNVKLRDPDGEQTYVVREEELLNMDAYSLERAQWKRYLHIKPSHIKEYIVRNLMTGADKVKAEKELDLIDNKRAVESGQRIVEVFEHHQKISPASVSGQEPLYRNAKKFIDYNADFYATFGYPLSQFWSGMLQGFDAKKFNQIVLKTKGNQFDMVKERWGKKGIKIYEGLCGE